MKEPVSDAGKGYISAMVAVLMLSPGALLDPLKKD